MPSTILRYNVVNECIFLNCFGGWRKNNGFKFIEVEELPHLRFAASDRLQDL